MSKQVNFHNTGYFNCFGGKTLAIGGGAGKRMLVNFERYKCVIILLINLTRTLKNNYNSCRFTHETTKNNVFGRIKL